VSRKNQKLVVGLLVSRHAPQSKSERPLSFKVDKELKCNLEHSRILLGFLIDPTNQHKSFQHALSSLARFPGNFSEGHSPKIAPSQSRLTVEFL